jgi:DNA replication and repair protein RecF
LKRTADERLIEIQANKENDIKIKIDGLLLKKKSSFTSLVDTVIFSPEDLVIVKGPPAGRRDFIDDLIEKTDRSFAQLRYKYQKILAQRNSLLKSASDVSSLKKNHTFDVWNENIADTGIKIIQKRLHMLKILKERFSENMERLFEGTNTDIEYRLSWQKEENNLFSPDELGSVYRENLLKNISKDLILKSTAIGPHRDDMIVFFNSRQIKSYGSQGQQRAASISLKLCELSILKEKNKRMPILLLDDALSELDENRKRFLLELINKKAQTFITAANVNYIKALDGIKKQLFFIKDNNIYEGKTNV